MTADGNVHRSRRRGEELLRAIYAAVVDELAASGYGGLTMEAVAARARTGKAPLYRRWPTKDDLILDTVRHGLPTGTTPIYSGDVRADIIDMLRQLGLALATPVGGAMRALLGETHRRPDLFAALDDAMFKPRGRELRALLAAAAANGEVRAAVIDSHVASIGHEMLMFRFLTEGPLVPDSTIVDIVDDLVMPLLSPPPRTAILDERRPDDDRVSTPVET